MILDDYDLEILKIFCKLNPETGETTTWKIMKIIYPKGRETQHELVKRRIKKMAKEKLFIFEGKPVTYILDPEIVSLRKFSFPDKRASAICIKVNCLWEVFEIN